MPDMIEMDPSAICVAVHSALERGCPICQAEKDELCIEEGEELPPYAVHIGRETGGAPLTVEHTGEYSSDGGAILRSVDN